MPQKKTMTKPSSTSLNIGELPWGTFLFLLLVFALVTPFDFSWPQTVQLKENFIDTGEAIARMEHGNMGRRIGMLLLAAFAILTLARTENRFRINQPVGWVLLFYFIWIIFSLTWSIDPVFTLRRVITVGILWFAATAIGSRHSLRELAALVVFVTGTTLVLAFANEIRLHTFNPVDNIWRFSGLFHTVAMGWNCGLLALAAMYLAHVDKQNTHRIFFYCVLAVSIVFLLLTKSRMAVAASLLSMGYFGFRVVSRRHKMLLVLSIISIACFSYLLLGDMLLYYGEEMSTLGRGDAAKESVSNLTGRIPLWTECFRFIIDKPVLGYGFNTFISPTNIETIYRNVGWLPNSVHSGFMDALMGLGFVGVGAMIISFALTLIRSLLLSKNSVDYIFVTSVLLWLYYNLLLEANLITMPTFMTFFGMILISRLAFLPGTEWKTGK